MSESAFEKEDSRSRAMFQFHWAWILAPLIVLTPFALDFGIFTAKYTERRNQILSVIRPGMTEPEVIKALRPHRFVTGIGNDTYYVELKIKRPLTVRAIIWAGQKLNKIKTPYRRLLPFEMCLIKMDSDQLVRKGDFLESWTELPF